MFKKVFGLIAFASVALVTNAMAVPITAPDFSGPIADMGIVFTAIVTLVVAILGFKYIRRMFS